MRAHQRLPEVTVRCKIYLMTNSRKNVKTSGFTLIELLIVISIIGLLSGLSIFALQGSRESSRDARRKADLETIRSGLELYRADCDTYPAGSGNADTVLGDPFTGSVGSCNSNTYIEDVPEDPRSGSYFYSSAGDSYRICAELEDPPASPDTCTGCASCNYRVTNP